MNCYKVIYTAVTNSHGQRIGKDGSCHVVADNPGNAGAVAQAKFYVPRTETHGRIHEVEVTVTGVHEIAKDVIVN